MRFNQGGLVRSRLWFLVVAVLFSSVVCSHHKSDEPQPLIGPVRVMVTNNYALPVEISASGGSISQRLGTVHPGMKAEFVIPANVTSTGVAELQASLISSQNTFKSGHLILNPGAFAVFVIGTRLFNSTVSIHP